MSEPPVLSPLQKIRVRGDLACFSRPEFKAERASYPWITPSAARNLFQSILWKPEMAWEIRRICLLKPIRFTSFLRNEINTKIPSGSNVPGSHYRCDENRAQRNTVALRDVDYLIEAELTLTDKGRADGQNIRKYIEMFQRRLEHGQYFTAPYLGCREFAADVMPAASGDEALIIADSLDHGLMLYDLVFGESGKAKETLFFHAAMKNGVVEVPPYARVLEGTA